MMVWGKAPLPMACSFSVNSPTKLTKADQQTGSALLLWLQGVLSPAPKFFKQSTLQLCGTPATLPCDEQGFR
jgi:hypothetical protein